MLRQTLKYRANMITVTTLQLPQLRQIRMAPNTQDLKWDLD